ncbi:MAG TPA: hypothetical protein VFE53_11420 [Mucilaginibacter sp.]|nr:hypothetical protein [Mucilaginibacter sp.]
MRHRQKSFIFEQSMNALNYLLQNLSISAAASVSPKSTAFCQSAQTSVLSFKKIFRPSWHFDGTYRTSYHIGRISYGTVRFYLKHTSIA